MGDTQRISHLLFIITKLAVLWRNAGHSLNSYDLSHAVCRTIALDERFEGYPLDVYTMPLKRILQRLRLVAYGHDVARGYGQVVVGIVQLIFELYGYNLKSLALQELHKRYIPLCESVLLLAALARIEVNGNPLRFTLLSIITTLDQGAEITIYDIEIGIEVHLHLPPLMVVHNGYGIVPKGVGVHNLSDSLDVGTHAASDKRDIVATQIVATLQSTITRNCEYRPHTQLLVAQGYNLGLEGSLRGVHLADNVPARSGYALVAREVEVHEWLMRIHRLNTRIIICVIECYRRTQQNTTNKVGARHLAYHISTILLRLGFNIANAL